MTNASKPDDGNGLRFSEGTLVLTGWSQAAIEKVFPDSPWVFDPRDQVWRCDALYYANIHQALATRAYGCPDLVPRWQSVAWSQHQLATLRAEQQAAVDEWLKHRNGIVVMPTGTGKTEVALRIIHELASSTLIVAPVRDLMYQWHRRIMKAFGYDAGIIGDGIMNARPISVTTYESAYIHMPRLGDRFKLLVFDECHHLAGEIRRDAARMSAAPHRLGLTATLERSDGRHVDLHRFIGPVIYRLELEKVRGKSLAEYQVIRIPVHLSDKEQARYDELSLTVRQYMYERRQDDPHFTWEDLCADSGNDPHARNALSAYRQKQSIEDRAAEKLRVLEDLFRLHAGTPMIIFTGSNAMARDVSRRFLIPCLLNHCGKRERLEVLDGLESGAYPALVANQVLDEGVDMPAVKIAVVIGGSSSTKQAKQRLGRILRKQGESRATLYEIVCQDTTEAKRSKKRRDNDAYQGTRHRRL